MMRGRIAILVSALATMMLMEALGLATGIAISVLAWTASPALGQEVTLYTGDGEPVAYIAFNDEMTIYLWGGEPVAYLEPSMVSFNVYGFNGQHLGWFERDVIWMRDGNAACALKQALTVGLYGEPGRYGKYGKPGKAGRYAPPGKPGYTNSFGAIPCSLFLAQGK
jgi:hypothetical protein